MSFNWWIDRIRYDDVLARRVMVILCHRCVLCVLVSSIQEVLEGSFLL